MSENERYVIEVADRIVDHVVNHVPFPDFMITRFMAGLRELKERMKNMEDDGK